MKKYDFGRVLRRRLGSGAGVREIKRISRCLMISSLRRTSIDRIELLMYMDTLGGVARVASGLLVDADWIRVHAGCVGVPTRGSPSGFVAEGILRTSLYDGSWINKISMSFWSFSSKVPVKLVLRLIFIQ